MSVCTKCKCKLSNNEQTLCDICYLDSIGLKETDLLDLESMLYIENLNTPIEFEFFYRWDMEKVKEYLAKKS